MAEIFQDFDKLHFKLCIGQCIAQWINRRVAVAQPIGQIVDVIVDTGVGQTAGCRVVPVAETLD